MNQQQDLKPLHPDTLLSPAKLAVFERWTTEQLIRSLVLGQEHCLKARPDGTMMDGHHRVHLLRRRDVNVSALAREVVCSEREHEPSE